MGPGFPLTWAVGREPGWFSVSKAGMEQPSEPQLHHPGQERLELTPTPARPWAPGLLWFPGPVTHQPSSSEPGGLPGALTFHP